MMKYELSKFNFSVIPFSFSLLLILFIKNESYLRGAMWLDSTSCLCCFTAALRRLPFDAVDWLCFLSLRRKYGD